MADEFENALKEATDQLVEMGYETAKNIEEKILKNGDMHDYK